MHDLLLRNAFMCMLLPILYASCQQTAKNKIRREKMHQLERLKTGRKKMDQVPCKIVSFDPISVSLIFSRKNGQQSFSALLPVPQNQSGMYCCLVNLYRIFMRLSCMAYLLFLLLKYCIAKTPPSTAMPMMSVRMVGSMRQRPPARRRRRSRIFALQ